jgi:hypothetical protein
MLRSFLLYTSLVLGVAATGQTATIHTNFSGVWGTVDAGHISGASAGDSFFASLLYDDAGLTGAGTEFALFESFRIVTGSIDATFLPGDFAEAKVRLQDGVLDFLEFRDDLGLVAECQFCSFNYRTDSTPEFEFAYGAPGVTVFEAESTDFVATMPEPGTFVLVAAGGLFLFFKRKRSSC